MSLHRRDKIARRAEQEIIANQVVNLGIGIPTLILKYLNWEKRVQIHSENGILGMKSHCSRETADRNLIDAGGGYIDLVKGASFFDSSLSFSIVRGGRLDIAFLGALDVRPKYALHLKERVGQAGMADRIQFLGFRDDFARFLVGADLFFHTAAWDPHPVVVLGAMAARLPVVAFSVDGLKEQVVDGKTGYLVPFGDVDGMARALGQCLGNPSLRERLGREGWWRVQTLFTAEEMSRRISRLICDILAKDTRGRVGG